MAQRGQPCGITARSRADIENGGGGGGQVGNDGFVYLGRVKSLVLCGQRISRGTFVSSSRTCHLSSRH